MARQIRPFTGPDGTNWGVEVQVPGASNAMIVFHHPGGKTARLDRYAWDIWSGPESRSVTSRGVGRQNHAISHGREATTSCFVALCPCRTTHSRRPSFLDLAIVAPVRQERILLRPLVLAPAASPLRQRASLGAWAAERLRGPAPTSREKSQQT